MSTRFFYVDESYDKHAFCLCALAIRDRDWQACFDSIREFRRKLKQDHGVKLTREIHAVEFVAGRGSLGPKIVSKRDRGLVYHALLQRVAKLPGAMLINVCLPNKGTKRDMQMVAWDRLINRIERTMRRFTEAELKERRRLIAELRAKGVDGEVLLAVERRLLAYSARAFIIADEGREAEITSALRRMHIHNHIPSKFGKWGITGAKTRNIVTERVIEDPVFKVSARSYFLQIADCIAYSLLKRESPVKTPTVIKSRLDRAFDENLAGICYRQACPSDPLGIVRK